MDRNKFIYKCLLLASSIVMIGSIVTRILTGNNTEEKIVIPITIVFFDVVFALIVYFGLKYPKVNRNYTIKLENGKLRFTRHHYPADPERLRLISSGILTFLFSLLMAIIVCARLLKKSDNWILFASIPITVLMCAAFYLIERVLSQKEQ